ncbi:MAG: WYL domain-containing transcriptional regulator [Peptococcaceae bacterium]|nr:MAG: WYL domain-containing transcriptional regulator [Peptococcaceae bacterium]
MGSKLSYHALNRPRIHRIFFIHKQVKVGRYPNGPALAAELEVSIRTIQRDIAYIRDLMQAPLEYDRNKNGFYYTGPFEMPPLTLTEGEQVALFLGQKLLRQCAGTPLEEPIRSAFEKICLYLPQGISVDLNLLEQIFSFDVQPLRGDEQRLAQVYRLLSQAIEKRNTVEMEYYTASRDDQTRRRVDPYHLRYYGGAWYLIAYCHLRREVRVFALDRIREAGLLEDNFEIEPGFNLESYFGSSLGIERGGPAEEVVVLFDSYQARWIQERKWHASQETELKPDGSLLLCLKVSGLSEVKRWLLSFGAHARVLEPPSLREEIRREAGAMMAVYEGETNCRG